MIKILIVEDDIDLQNLMRDYLEGSGYHCFLAEHGEAALDVLADTSIDLIITDVMMPVMDGYQLTKELRDCGYEMPIMMLTAKETLNDKEEGFLAGTDDYMVKPVVLKEMLLRIKSLLRRVQIKEEKQIEIGDFQLNYDTYTAHWKKEEIELSAKEFQLLFKLLAQPGKIFTKASLMDEIWGYESESTDQTVKVHISRLRNKLADCNVFELVAVKGIGYKAVVR